MVTQSEREERQKADLEKNQAAYEEFNKALEETQDRYSESETAYQLKAHNITLDNITQDRFNTLSKTAQGILLKEQAQAEQAFQQEKQRQEESRASIPEPSYDGIPENVPSQKQSQDFYGGKREESSILSGFGDEIAETGPTAKASVLKEPFPTLSDESLGLVSAAEQYKQQKGQGRSSRGNALDLNVLGGYNQTLRTGRGDRFNVPKKEIQRDILELDYRVPTELLTVDITPTIGTKTTTQTIERFVIQDRVQKAELLGQISQAKASGAKTIEIVDPLTGSVRSVPIQRARYEILKTGIKTKEPVSFSYKGAPEIAGVTTIRVPATTERKEEVRQERKELSNFIGQAKASGVTDVIISSGDSGKLVKVKNLNRELAIFKRGLPNNAEVTIAVPQGITHNLSGDISEQKSGIPAIDFTREVIGAVSAPIQNLIAPFYFTPERYIESASGKIKYSPSDITLPTIASLAGPLAITAKNAGVYDFLGIKITETTSPVQKKIEEKTQPTPISNLFELKSPITGKGPVYDIVSTITEAGLLFAPVFVGKFGGGRSKSGKITRGIESDLLKEFKTTRKTPTYRNTNLYRDFYEVKQGKATTKPGKYNIFDFDTAEPGYVVKKGKGLGGTTDTPPSFGPSDITGFLPRTKGGGTYERKIFKEPEEKGSPTRGRQLTILEKPIPVKPIEELIKIQKPVTKQKKKKEELAYEQFSPQIKPISISTKAESITLQYLDDLALKRRRRQRQTQEELFDFIQVPKSKSKSKTSLAFFPELDIKERQRFSLDLLTPQQTKQKEKIGFDILAKQSTKQTPLMKLELKTDLMSGFKQRQRITTATTTPTTTKQTTIQRTTTRPGTLLDFKIPPIFFGGGRGGGGGPRKPRSKSFDIYSVNPDIIGSIAQAGIEPLSSSRSPSIFGKVERKLAKSGRAKDKLGSILDNPLGTTTKKRKKGKNKDFDFNFDLGF